MEETNTNTRQEDGIGSTSLIPDSMQPPAIPPRNEGQKCSQTNRNDQNDDDTKICMVAEVHHPQMGAASNGEHENTTTDSDNSTDNEGYETYDPKTTASESTSCALNNNGEIVANETDCTTWTERATTCGYKKRHSQMISTGNEESKFLMPNLDQCKISMSPDAILDDKVISPNTSRPNMVNPCCEKGQSIFKNVDIISTSSRSIGQGAYDKYITETDMSQYASNPRSNGKSIPMAMVTVTRRPWCSGYEHLNPETTEPTNVSLRGYEKLNPETMEPMHRSNANTHTCNLNGTLSFQDEATKKKQEKHAIILILTQWLVVSLKPLIVKMLGCTGMDGIHFIRTNMDIDHKIK